MTIGIVILLIFSMVPSHSVLAAQEDRNAFLQKCHLALDTIVQERQQEEQEIEKLTEFVQKQEEKTREEEKKELSEQAVKALSAEKTETVVAEQPLDKEAKKQQMMNTILKPDTSKTQKTEENSITETEYEKALHVVEVDLATLSEEEIPTPSDSNEGNPAIIPIPGKVTQEGNIYITENPVNFPNFTSWFADVNQCPGTENVTSMMGRSADYDKVRKKEGRTDYEHWGPDVSCGELLTNALAVAPIDCTVDMLDDGYNTIILRPDAGSEYADYIDRILYLHSSGLLEGIQPGDHVTSGTPIAYIGGYGPSGSEAYPVHLHVNVIDKRDQFIDPLLFQDVKGTAPYDHISDRLSITTKRYWDFTECMYWY